MKFRLCLFWRKTISGNDFTPHRVFGCAWKIEFSGKAFHLAVNIMALTLKLIYISIFTSNHFWTQTHKEGEREREEITGTLPHAPQKISTLLRKSLLTHSHHSRQAQAEGRRELLPVKPRSSPRPTAPSVWSRCSNPLPIWSRHLNSSIVLKPISNEPGLIVLAFASATWSRLHLHCAISPLDQTHSPLSLPSSLNLIEFDDFFFFLVLFLLCFSI